MLEGGAVRRRRASAGTSVRASTKRALFTLSGNRCAFPECPTALIDPATGSFLGQACHIKGDKPGSPRFDASQSDEERHALSNLIAMCPTHHASIDNRDNLATYTVEHLRELKEVAEAPQRVSRGELGGTAGIVVQVLDASYHGTHPYKDEFKVHAMICRVALRNPSVTPNTIASVHLETSGRPPISSAEHQSGRRGRDVLVPRGGGWSSVPSKDRWLQLPAELEPWGAETAWVGFVFLEPGDDLTFGEARRWTPELVVMPVRGDPGRATVPACSWPDLSPADEPHP